jgi:hypothetical protein
MNELDFLDAINELTNRVGFKIVGMDLDTLKIADESKKPTLQEIEAKIAEMTKINDAEKAEKASRKTAVLDRLGLTEDEAKLLLG